ncbi:MAG: Segregation and condensation protein A [Candidatus Scalindua arabica]|uniref:Segregation and condensation protein A n=1 Tax=Candidatus Scalindua arabica TaxID=1127984 RepID=A0A941W3Y7_9BACT|nr:Segregation and condensation protein A [Candidatus Scalindua arabica]
MQTEYKIDLDIYNGPLDLLLYLIRREEVDVYDIPIAKITDQYMTYLGKLQSIDIGLAGDFLVMASTLMYIKSQTLLPRSEVVDGEDEDDPRLELVKQLLEYKRYKEATTAMTRLSEERGQRFSRPEERLIDDEKEGEEKLHLDEIDVWKLAQFFSTFMKQTMGDVIKKIIYDDTPVQVYMDKVINSLNSVHAISFKELLYNANGKEEIIGIFLALLELVRLKKIKLEQFQDFDEIRVTANDN